MAIKNYLDETGLSTLWSNIQTAISEATGANSSDISTLSSTVSSLSSAVTANSTDITTLKGDATTEGSVAYQIAQIVAGADGSFDTLKEIADWIQNDTTGAAKMSSDISLNKASIEALEALVGNSSVASQIMAALQVNGVDKYALASNLTALANSVSGIEGRVQTLEGLVTAQKVTAWNTAEVNAKNYADSLFENFQPLTQQEIETIINI